MPSICKVLESSLTGYAVVLQAQNVSPAKSEVAIATEAW